MSRSSSDRPSGGQAPVVFDGVWKKFRRGARNDTLRDLIPALVGRLVSPKARSLGQEEFWALREVSFTVSPGEALGIIGPNGAGKSTILKLLTRILRPTRGACRTRGRVGALIEVAAGFHPDLTARENVFLQGAIMGMPRREIEAKFDEIVAFAELEDFLEMPIKRYSTGMNARLGFSVAAHLDPDVLLIDEVLAVGDFSFQQKAFGRIREIVERDIPVVVVSHQLERIHSLCNRALYLEQGRVLLEGTPEECIERYIGAGESRAVDPRHAESPVRIEALRAPKTNAARSGERIVLEAQIATDDVPLGHTNGASFMVISCNTGETVHKAATAKSGLELPRGRRFTLEIDLQMNVPPGMYRVESLVWDRKMRREIFRGPSLVLLVEEGTVFDGSVQLNPRMRIADG